MQKQITLRDILNEYGESYISRNHITKLQWLDKRMKELLPVRWDVTINYKNVTKIMDKLQEEFKELT